MSERRLNNWTPRDMNGLHLWIDPASPQNVVDRDGNMLLLVNLAGRPSWRDRWMRFYWRMRVFFGYRAKRVLSE